MPVGTLGSVKGIFPDDLKKIGVQIILGNTLAIGRLCTNLRGF